MAKYSNYATIYNSLAYLEDAKEGLENAAAKIEARISKLQDELAGVNEQKRRIELSFAALQQSKMPGQ